MIPPADVRALVPDDLDWVAGLAQTRRDALVTLAPRLWNPAPDAARQHRAFVAHLVDDPAAVTVRTDDGYLVALDRPAHRLVDDLVLPDHAWATQGVALLRHVLDGGRRTRLVAGAVEQPRRDVAVEVGLVPTEVWWHRDLPVTRPAPTSPGLKIGETLGRLVPAPPVHSPGGPVLLVTRVDTAANLARLESEATAGGAVVSVVTSRPDDVALDLLLLDAGYVLTSVFYESPPVG